MAAPEQPTNTENTDSTTSETSHLRNSSILVAGRVVAMVLNLVTQVAAVNYLTKAQFGAFAYALSMSALAANVALLGQDQSLSMFLPKYGTARQNSRSRGATIFAFVLVTLAGAIVALGVISLSLLDVQITSDPRATSVLIILILVAPLTALDELFVSLFAVLGRPMAIFWRRQVLTPALRLASVLTVIAFAGSERMLAWAYLVAAVFGVLLYVLMLRTSTGGSLNRNQIRHNQYPAREMLTFGLPVYVSTLLTASRNTVIIILLGALQSSEEIAGFRAVFPVAVVNLVGIHSFRILYMPTASKLFHDNNLAAVRNVYWRSAGWLAVGTFPIFVITFALADPLTTLLFGADYADSGPVLALLALGYYFSSTLGLNTHTLRASGNVQILLIVDIVAWLVVLGVGLVAIGRYGAFGAAATTVASITVQNLLTQLGLRRQLGSLAFPRSQAKVYVTIIIAVSAVGVMQTMLSPPLILSVTVAAAVSMLILRINRDALRVDDVIPEVRRIPLLNRLLD